MTQKDNKNKDKFEIIRERLESLSIEQLENALKKVEPASKKQSHTIMIGGLLLALFEIVSFFVFQKFGLGDPLTTVIFGISSFVLILIGFWLRHNNKKVIGIMKEKLEEKRLNPDSRRAAKLEIISDQSNGGESNDDEFRERFGKLETYLLFLSIAGFILLIVASYFHNIFLKSLPMNLVPYGSPLGVSQFLLAELYLSVIAGFGCWIFGIYFLYKISSNLQDIDTSKFRNKPFQTLLLLGLVVTVLCGYFASMLGYPAGSYLPPSNSDPGLHEIYSQELSALIAGQVIMLLIMPVSIIDAVVDFSVLLRKTNGLLDRRYILFAVVFLIVSFSITLYTFFV